jgi:ATP-dependent Clp protease ATP-binding subunit ClpB
MTSNIGSHRILDYRGGYEGQEYQRMKDAVLGELRQAFRPEFLNRLDEIIVFHSLTEEHLKQIVDIQLLGLNARLDERHISLKLTDAARTVLVRSGYDPTYGARPLKRAIQREIETPLAKQILGGSVRDGQTVWIDADTAGSGLRFEANAPVVEAEHATVS